jgi:outer membrane protease
MDEHAPPGCTCSAPRRYVSFNMMHTIREIVRPAERRTQRGSAGTRARRLFTVLGLLCAGLAGAQQVSLSVSTTAGVFLGGVTEVVLDQGYKVSELDWPLLPVITSGATLDLRTQAGFRAVLAVQKGFPMYDGTMTYSDFLNGDGVKTHFSQANAFSEGMTVVDARVGWSFGLSTAGARTAELFPFLSFQYLQLKWSAHDGFLQYPIETQPPYTPWSASEPKVPVYGTGIIYEQDYYIPALGVSGTFPLSRSVSMTLAFTFSPYLWCNDIDDHVFRLIDFYTNMSGGFLLEPQASVTFQVTPTIGLTVDALYRHISQLSGSSYAVGQGAVGYTQSGLLPGTQTLPVTNGGGASLDAGTITVSLDLAL